MLRSWQQQKHGHLEIIKLLQDYGAPNSYEPALVYAAQNGHFEIVQWLFFSLRKSSSPGQRESAECGAVSQAYGHMDIAMWLHSQWKSTAGHRPSYIPILATDTVQLHAVQWMTKNTD